MTKAAILFGPDQPVEVHDIRVEDPHPGEIRVRMAASGVCHSDMHSIEAGGAGLRLPIVPGHEASGIVEQVADDVTELVPGDHVILKVFPQCGTCEQCNAGLPTLCLHGRSKVRTGTLADGTTRLWLGDESLGQYAGMGSWTEQTVVPASSAVKIDPRMPLTQAALIGCGVVTGFGAVTNVARIKPGSTVAVIGCGGLGLNAIQAARIEGAAQILAVDVTSNKFDLARKLGATDVVNSSETDPVEFAREITGGLSVDAALDFVGAAASTNHALLMTRSGGTVVYTGLAAPTISFPTGELVGGARTLRGNLMGMGWFPDEFAKLVGLYQKGELLLDELVSREIGLGEVDVAFEAMRQGEGARSVITFPS
jgi:S-(hydroxymethyl)glutathione dehydrogenase/alcohol dehydrogenase